MPSSLFRLRLFSVRMFPRKLLLFQNNRIVFEIARLRYSRRAAMVQEAPLKIYARGFHWKRLSKIKSGKNACALRSEPPRTSIQCVLSEQNITFRLFALAMQTLEKLLVNCPSAPQNYSCSVDSENKKVFNKKKRKALQWTLRNKPKSDFNVYQNVNPNSSQIQSWNKVVQEGVKTQKRHQKVAESRKTDPRITNNLEQKSAGNRLGFCFLKINSANFLSRHEARCDSKPSCKGNLTYEGTQAQRPSEHMRTRLFSYSLAKGSLKPCPVH